jgi:hypothetical protein
MKTYRSTFALAVLFFSALLALWWLEASGVLTEAQRRDRMEYILPELMSTKEADIARVEITRNGQTLSFERRGKDRWQMTEPVDAAADATNLETLVRNFKGLRRSPETGTITGSGESYGLAPPAAVVRLWDSAGLATGKTSSPLAVLEIGQTARDFCYARSAGSQGIEVVSKKLLAFVDRPAIEWREPNLVPIPSFQVTGLTIHRHGMDVKAERSSSGRWRLTAPVPFPANGPKIESALAALSAIRVVDGAKGFVADNVTDLAPYGLAEPDATIELFTPDQPDTPLVLHVGKKPPDHPDRVYVRRGDQDDVVMVSDRFLPEIPKDTIALRAQDVADIFPAAVSQFEIKALGSTFTLVRKRDGWALQSPHAEKADTVLVQAFLSALDGLKTSEFLAISRVPRPELDPPAMAVRVWQLSRSAPPSEKQDQAASPPREAPALSLKIGRHDRLKKTVYGQIEGDDVILALPDSLLDLLPRTQYAFRDRGVLSVSPAGVTKLSLFREGTRTVLEPDRSSKSPNRWQMIEPVKAQADTAAITQVLALLSDLRAEDFVADSLGDGKLFGLDHPPIVVTWNSEAAPGIVPDATAKPAPTTAPNRSTGKLQIGYPVPVKPGTFYASVEGLQFVFTLAAPAIAALAAEFHETQVMSLPADSVRRLVFRAPGRTMAFARDAKPTGTPADWNPEPGTDARTVDLSRFNDLMVHIAQLRTPRFFQYDGPFPDAAGLSQPRLVVELHSTDGKSQVLRLGQTTGGMVLAATGTANSGPIFLLAGGAWNALIQTLSPVEELPDNPFAP